MKVGLIGCGGMGTVHNLSLKALSECYNIEVTAIADIREEFLEKARKIWPDAKGYSTGMELIKEAEVDVIHICLPSYLHVTHAIEALRKGCHVFIEKPVCLNEADGKALLEAKKKSGKKVMVGHVVRFFPEYDFLKQLYDHKTYGKLKSIILKRLGGDPVWGYDDWFHDVNKSGSVVLDLHIHDSDYLRYLLGEPEDVTVRAAKFESGMINQIVSLYEYKDLFALAEGNWDVSKNMTFESSYRACFEGGTVVFSSIQEPKVTIYFPDGRVCHPELIHEYDVQDNSAGINISNLGPYYTEIKYFIEQVESGQPVKRASLEDGFKSVTLALEEYQKAMNQNNKKGGNYYV